MITLLLTPLPPPLSPPSLPSSLYPTLPIQKATNFHLMSLAKNKRWFMIGPRALLPQRPCCELSVWLFHCIITANTGPTVRERLGGRSSVLRFLRNCNWEWILCVCVFCLPLQQCAVGSHSSFSDWPQASQRFTCDLEVRVFLFVYSHGLLYVLWDDFIVPY